MAEDRRIKVGAFETELSLAVRLQDAFTGGHPGGSPDVELADRDDRFTRNPSDYYVVTDLPDAVTSVTVAVDAGDRYLPEQRDVDLSELDRLNPVEAIELYPSPAYRFPADATLLRGFVYDADGDPLPGADLTVEDWPAATRSDADGEFVLFLSGLTADDVTDGTGNGGGGPSGNGGGGPNGNGGGGQNGNGGGGSNGDEQEEGMVTIDGSDPTVRATHPEAGTTTESVAVEEGTTAVVDVEY